MRYATAMHEEAPSTGDEIIATLREQLGELGFRERRQLNFDDYTSARDGLSKREMGAVYLTCNRGRFDWLESHHPRRHHRACEALGEQLSSPEKQVYANRLWDNICDTYLMHRLGIPGEPPHVMGLATPNFQFAYPLGPEDSDDTPWCQWRNLRRDELTRAAHFLTGEDAGGFKEFAEWMAPAMNDDEELLVALERLGYVQSAKSDMAQPQ